jgi:PKD repeat protein
LNVTSVIVTLISANVWLSTNAFAQSGPIAQRPARAGNRPPIADVGGPYAGTVGQELLLSATRSTDADGDTLAFAWEFGDGSSASAPSSNHAYRSAGVYTVRVLVSDGRGGVATASTRVIITTSRPGNRPPDLVVGGPFAGVVGRQVTLDAFGLSDPDGDQPTCVWSLGDGTVLVGRRVSHVYAHPGTYVVRVLAADGVGGASRATTTAIIAERSGRSDNRPPLARVSAPERAWPGQLVEFDASDSVDPDGDRLSYAWTFPDGETASGPAVTHAFASSGTHTVELLVSDGHGGTDKTSLEIELHETEGNERPVAVVGGPHAGMVGIPVLFNAGASQDPDGDELTFLWNFGDDAMGVGAAPEHTYEKPGTYPVTVLVSDDNGGSVRASTYVFVIPRPHVGNTPLSTHAGGPYSGTAGQPITFRAVASSDPDLDDLTYAWMFGDGSVATGATPTHKYHSAGRYTAVLLVTDGNGGSDASARPVTIADASRRQASAAPAK